MYPRIEQWKAVFLSLTINDQWTEKELNLRFPFFQGYKNEAMNVTQLAERSIPTSNIRGSNPDIDEMFLFYPTAWQLQLRKDENKIKVGWERPI